MFRRTSEDLGLDIVLKNVSAHALSSEGRNAVLFAKPVSDVQRYMNRQGCVASTLYAISRSGVENIHPEQFPDISVALDFMSSDPLSSFEGTQIYDIGLYIQSACSLRCLFRLCDETDNRDRELGASEIISEVDCSLILLRDEIFRILESPGTVRDNYPTVRALREKADRTRLERTKVAGSFMHNNASLMQADEAVLRDGRIVLPVKNDSKNRLEGYVQSSSQSGNTVFMEPFALVDMNNAVVMAQQEILIEIARLIKHLSDEIRANEGALRNLVSQVRDADFLYAFASWSAENRCCRTLYSQDCTVNLIKARHPLLGSKCVPIDLKIPSDIKAVVLTGPNAGGKTVTMKTVGLFVLLNQICGFIPCDDGSALALFDRVFTDIGDDQSIQMQLSTFSGHMNSIGFILRNATDRSLVILDELGSGTDPQEGAALARSILEYSSSKVLLTLTTSHHGVLKQYAYSSRGVMNASMEFDEKTLEPTFKVINGLPGESHAIDTAVRMHLPKIVTESAKKYMGEEAVKISSIIRGLEAKRHETDAKLEEVSRRLRGIENQENHLKNEQRRVTAYENKLRKSMLSDFDDYIKESRRNLENLVRQLREGEITKEKTANVKLFISSLEKEEKKIRSKAEETDREIEKHEMSEMERSPSNMKIEVGMDVYCGPGRREGTVVREEKDGRWVVAIGPMKFTFKETELTVPRRTEKVKGVSYQIEGSSSVPKPKLNMDLRGYRLAEALEAIDDQIEGCCVYGISSFSIVHGYGDGILSAGIHKHLSMKENVKQIRFAIPEDGGQGKTYVTLR